MKSILFVLNAGVGGAERMTVLYAKLLQQQGYKCSLVIIQERHKPFTMKPFVGNDLKYYLIYCPYNKLVYFYLPWFLIWHKFDIVFSSLSYLNYTVLWCKAKKIHKGTVVIRMNTAPDRLTELLNKKCKQYYPLADAIISQTEEMKQEMVSIYELPDEAITVINNPIDRAYISECIKETFAFDNGFINYVAVGRINPIKDYNTLLSAFVKVRESQPQSRLYVVGKTASDEQMKVLLDYLKENDALEFVFFEGLQNNPYKYLQGCNVYVLSSIKEGLPNALLEAMYLGKPVVSTRCLPFVEQVIKEGKNGYSVPVGDATAMAEAMRKAVRLTGIKSYSSEESERKIVELFKEL